MNVNIVKINKKEVHILVQEIDEAKIGHLKTLISISLKILFNKNLVNPLLDVFKTSNQKDLIVHITRTKNILFIKEKYVDFFNKKTCLSEIKNAIYSAERQANKNYEIAKNIQNDISKIIAHQKFQNQN